MTTTTKKPRTAPVSEVIYDLPVKPACDPWTKKTRQPVVTQVACRDAKMNKLLADHPAERKAVLTTLATWYGFSRPTPAHMARPFYLPDPSTSGEYPDGKVFVHPVGATEFSVSSNIACVPTTGCCGAKLLATFPGYIEQPIKKVRPVVEYLIHRHLDHLIKEKDGSSSGIYYIFLTSRQVNLYDPYLRSYGFYPAGEQFRNPKTSARIQTYAFHPANAKVPQTDD